MRDGICGDSRYGLGLLRVSLYFLELPLMGSGSLGFPVMAGLRRSRWSLTSRSAICLTRCNRICRWVQSVLHPSFGSIRRSSSWALAGCVGHNLAFSSPRDPSASAKPDGHTSPTRVGVGADLRRCLPQLRGRPPITPLNVTFLLGLR